MTSSSNSFAPASTGPTTTLPGSLDAVLPELTTTQERYDQGYKRGYLAGYADGARQAQAERAADLASHKAAFAAVQADAGKLLSGLATATQEHMARLRAEAPGISDALVGVAFELAEAVLGCELRARPEIVIESARRALASLPDGGPAVVRVHPDDEPILRDAAGSLSCNRAGQGVAVLADQGVERGGCIVNSGGSTIDARVTEAVARARAAFSATSAGTGGAEAGDAWARGGGSPA
jgi:flagellar assembly protein FliH